MTKKRIKVRKKRSLRRNASTKPPNGLTLQYAPWIEDPDPPDYMTDEDMKKMADGIAKYMKWDKPPSSKS